MELLLFSTMGSMLVICIGRSIAVKSMHAGMPADDRLSPAAAVRRPPGWLVCFPDGAAALGRVDTVLATVRLNGRLDRLNAV